MEKVLKKLDERLQKLESRKQTSFTEGRIAELLLTKVMIQEIILQELNSTEHT